MTSLVLGDLILESLTPSVNAPSRGLTPKGEGTSVRPHS
jgi:hypothetical protein